MRRYILFAFLAGFSVLLSSAPLDAAELSGVLDSTVNYTAGAGSAPGHSFGLEEYANLRLRARTGDRGTFFAAFNVTAVFGNYALLSVTNGLAVSGENYAAAMELERLYFRINGDYVDAEAGLLRMNFGYGNVWGSSDFLNPRNPLFPNARPRGVLGINAAFYPEDSLKFMTFITAPKNPLNYEGDGFIPGLSMDKHWDRASLQALYSFETPGFGEKYAGVAENGIHRFGLSLKADLELGFALDALYTLNPDKYEKIEGLSLGAGFDYNFFGGIFYILAEYLFNGSASATARGFGGDWSNHHYMCGSLAYRFNDYCSMNISTLFCFDDLSFTPLAALNYEVFQGFTLNFSVRAPLDQKTLGNGKAGELGPVPPWPDGTAGARLIVNAGAKLRF